MKTSDEIERQKKRDATRLKRELAAEKRKNKNDKKGELRALQKKISSIQSKSQKIPVHSNHSTRTSERLKNVSKKVSTRMSLSSDSSPLPGENISHEKLERDSSIEKLSIQSKSQKIPVHSNHRTRTSERLKNVSKKLSTRISLRSDSPPLLEENIADENLERDSSDLVFTQKSTWSDSSHLLEENIPDEKFERDCCGRKSSKKQINIKLQLKSARRREQRLRREVAALQKVIDEKNKIINNLRLKLCRLTMKKETTPERNVRKIMKEFKLEIKKRLLSAEVLKKQLKENKGKLKTEKDKSIYSQIIAGKIIKKYKCMKSISNLVSPYLQRKTLSAETLKYNRSRIQQTKLHELMKKSVQDFLEKDQNSALAPGKKDTIMKFGLKMRKRYLQDSVDNLYEKFCTESTVKMSRSQFFMLKPFWIMQQPISARNTCLCKVHANIDLILQKLLHLKVLTSSSTRKFTDSVTCDSSAKTCMYRECANCKERSVTLPNNSDPSFYYQWITKTEDRVGTKNVNYRVKITKKKNKIECHTVDIVNELNLRTSAYLQHVYNTGHQHKFFENLRNNLNENEVMIVIDFSEKYYCKYSAEIQSVHFGASKKQISLHTGVFFYFDSDSETVE